MSTSKNGSHHRGFLRAVVVVRRQYVIPSSCVRKKEKKDAKESEKSGLCIILYCRVNELGGECVQEGELMRCIIDLHWTSSLSLFPSPRAPPPMPPVLSINVGQLDERTD